MGGVEAEGRSGPGDGGAGEGGGALVRHALGNYTHPADPGEPTTGRYRVSVTDEECKVLAWLARGLDVLEIGTGIGVSTRALASEASSVETVDPDPWVQETVWPALRELHRVECYPAVSEAPYSPLFDLVFIDGDHEEEAVGKDIDAALRLLMADGLLVLHDCNYDGVRKALEKRGLRALVLPTAGHLGLVWRE